MPASADVTLRRVNSGVSAPDTLPPSKRNAWFLTQRQGSGWLPTAATFSVTVSPGSAVRLVGCRVITGGDGMIASAAFELTATPAALLTMTE